MQVVVGSDAERAMTMTAATRGRIEAAISHGNRLPLTTRGLPRRMTSALTPRKAAAMIRMGATKRSLSAALGSIVASCAFPGDRLCVRPTASSSAKRPGALPGTKSRVLYGKLPGGSGQAYKDYRPSWQARQERAVAQPAGSAEGPCAPPSRDRLVAQQDIP